MREMNDEDFDRLVAAVADAVVNKLEEKAVPTQRTVNLCVFSEWGNAYYEKAVTRTFQLERGDVYYVHVGGNNGNDGQKNKKVLRTIIFQKDCNDEYPHPTVWAMIKNIGDKEIENLTEQGWTEKKIQHGTVLQFLRGEVA